MKGISENIIIFNTVKKSRFKILPVIFSVITNFPYYLEKLKF